MSPEFKGMQEIYSIWQFKGKVTQPVGAPATMGLDFTPRNGQRVKLLLARTGADNYGSARTIDIRLLDEAAGAVMFFLQGSVDNQQLNMAQLTEAAAATATTVALVGYPKDMEIAAPYSFRVIGASLLSTEFIRTWIVAKVTGNITLPPLVATVGAGVLLSDTSNMLV